MIKDWVKFVAMQQKSAALICELNALKGAVESCLEKIAQPFKALHCST